MSGPEASQSQMMKSYIWLQTADSSFEQVERDVGMFCPFIQHQIHAGVGSSRTQPISLPADVNHNILGVIFDFCRFHHFPGRSKLELKNFYGKFFRMETERLRELLIAADCLQMTELVDLGCDACARQLAGKSNEEIRHALGLPDDVTEEESWNPITIAQDDPQVRLLNKLYAKKRKELKEKENIVEPVQAPHTDDRSIDELLSFINGENEDSKEAKPSKSKKKNRNGKDKQK